MLVRRLRERAANPTMQCIGTSATMSSGGSRQERAAAIASVASTLFGVRVAAEHVVDETLQRAFADSPAANGGNATHCADKPTTTRALVVGSISRAPTGAMDRAHLPARKWTAGICAAASRSP